MNATLGRKNGPVHTREAIAKKTRVEFNNVMLDDVTQAGICVIDLDTVMPGVALNDFGDMVRSATNSVAEDDRDVSAVHARLPIFEALVEGYLSAARPFLNEAEVAHLAISGQVITFVIGCSLSSASTSFLTMPMKFCGRPTVLSASAIRLIGISRYEM